MPTRITVQVLAVVLGLSIAAPASAVPLTAASGIAAAASDLGAVEPVQHRGSGGRGSYRGGYRGHGGGGGNDGGAVTAGIIGGLLLGAIIAGSVQQQRSVEYCARRYRSYDPYSRTYLGHDGYRHACP